MGENLVAGILKNIETLASINANQNVAILTGIKKTNTLLSDQIGKELSKQTKLLESLLGAAANGSVNNSISEQTKILESALSAIAKGTTSNSFSVFNSSGTASFSKMFKKKGGKQLQAMAIGMDKFADATKKFVDAVNELDEEKFDKFALLFDMGKKILLFSLAILLAGPLLAIGLVTTLPFLIAWVFFFKWAGSMTKDLEKGSDALKKLSISVLLIAVSIGITALVLNKVGLLKVFVVVAILFLVALTFLVISKIDKQAKDGAKSMMFLAITTATLVAVIILTSKFVETVGLRAIALVAGVLLGVAIVYVLISLFNKKANGGAKSMLFLALTTAIIVAVIIFASKFIEDVGFVAVALVLGVLLAVAIVYVIISLFDKQANTGAKSMIFIAIATAIIVGILYFMTTIPLKRFAAAALMLGVVLVGLVIVFVIAGALKAQIIPGAISMLIVAVVVAIIAFSLIKYQEANVTGESVAILSAFIVGMGIAFGLAGLAAPFIILGGVAMLVVAGAIFVFTESLVNFSKAEWSNDKTIMLSTAIKDLVGALVVAFADVGILGMAKLFAGVKLLNNLGNALSAFAQGVGSFANLELSEVTQEGEGENAKYTVKTKGAINPAAISSNIALLLQEVTGPLKDFGAANSDGGGWFSKGNLGTGIELLGKLGNALGSFALGMSFFGMMKTVKFDEKGQVIPGTEKGINIGGIGTGITKMLNALTAPLTTLGDNDDIEDGIKFLGLIGQPLESFANAITTFSTAKIEPEQFKKAFTDPLKSIITTLTSDEFKKMDEDRVKTFFEGIESFTESIEKMKAPKEIGKMFVDVKESINGMNLSKLTKLNTLAENLTKFAVSMDGNFDKLEAVLEKLKEAIGAMNEIQTESDEGAVATTGPVAEPTSQSNTSTAENSQTLKAIDLEPLLSELEDVTDILRGGIDVNINNNSFG